MPSIDDIVKSPQMLVAGSLILVGTMAVLLVAGIVLGEDEEADGYVPGIPTRDPKSRKK